MVNWQRFTPSDFEYDFEGDKLSVHGVTFNEAIDKVVLAQADDDSAWEEPIRVRRSQTDSLSIPGELIERASFLAKLHREKETKEWLTRIIRERVELEEIAFAEVKRELQEKQVPP